MKTWVVSALETAMNRYVQSDEASVQALQDWVGKTLAIEITDLSLCLYITVTDYGFEVTDESERVPHTRLSGTAPSFIQMGINKASRSSFFSSDMTVSGDLELGEAIRSILGEVDVDWEAVLSERMGEPMAGHLVRGVGKVRSVLCHAMRSTASSVEQYVFHEAQWLPLKSSVKVWSDDVAMTRNDVERLALRVARLVKSRMRD